MAEFIDKLPTSKTVKLLNRMKIKTDENVLNAEVSARGGKLYVIHGKDKNGDYIESIYSDFAIIKIYNCTPSDYDQLVFQQTMKELCAPTYAHKCNQFNRQKGKLSNDDFEIGNFDEEENE